MKFKAPLAAIILIVIAAIFIIYNKSDQASTNNASDSPTGNTDVARPNRTTTEDHRSGRKSTTTDLAQLDWTEKVNYVLASDDISTEEATRTLLGVAGDPKAPTEVRNDALEHALNLIDDANFSDVQDIMGTGADELPEPLVQTVLDDTLNRTESIQLDTALIVMKGSHSEVSEEARELLEFHLDQELGNDVQMWKKAVRVYKAQQAKETVTPK